jgi:topoisomerase IA-like protein
MDADASSLLPQPRIPLPLDQPLPHLGSAALGTVVNLANQNQLERDGMFRTIEAQREQISRQLAEIQRLEYELQQVKLELKLERQNKFATHQQQSAIGETPRAGTGCFVRSGRRV